MLIKYFTYLLLLVASTIHADDHIQSDNLIVVILDKNSHTLSQKIDAFFKQDDVQNIIQENNQQLFVLYAQDHLEYAKALGTKYLPTIYHLRKINNTWYKTRTFDPAKETMTLSRIKTFLSNKIINKIRRQPGST
jgi:hypothetical protein